MFHTRRFAPLFLLCACGGIWSSAFAQIPTRDERIRESGLNPEYSRWTAETLQLIKPAGQTNPPPTMACYRHDFVLAAKPRRAEITVLAIWYPCYTLKANGVIVFDNLEDAKLQRRLQWKGPRRHDLAKFLRAGTNTLTLQTLTVDRLTVEGMVFDEQGGAVRLRSDGRWRGGWDLPAGWDDPRRNPPEPGRVRSLGRVVSLTGDSEVNLDYYGPIQVEPAGLPEPIFDEEKPAELKITVVNGRKPETRNPRPNILYEIMDEESRKTVGQGAVDLKAEGALDLGGTLRFGPLAKGAYRFRFDLLDGTNRIDRRDYEVASVGKIKQPVTEGLAFEDGLNLKKVWSINCAAEPAAAGGDMSGAGTNPIPNFVVGIWNWSGTNAATEVREGPLGRYRAFLRPGRGERPFFAYRFKVRRLYAPHLAVIEWPDDARRSMQVQVMERSSVYPPGYAAAPFGWQRGEAAFMSTAQHQPSGKLQKLSFIYWPNEEDEAIHVMDLAGAEPAAVSKIAIYEIAGEIPALQIADAGERLIGCHSERGPQTMAATYYAGPVGAWFGQNWAGMDHPEFLRNWYGATENMIKSMRFSGQNLYVMGQFMYAHAYYPSRSGAFAFGLYHGGDYVRNYGALLLQMFDRNGMAMISGVEFRHLVLALSRGATPGAEGIRQGEMHFQVVSKDGERGGYNYFHPRVQEVVLQLIGELVELNKPYPAWKGIGFMLSREMGPLLAVSRPKRGQTTEVNPLDWGYEDYTIEAFEKDTGIKVPDTGDRKPDAGRRTTDDGDRKPETGGTVVECGIPSGGTTPPPQPATLASSLSPDRFAQRHAWLKANARDRWIDWRCRRMTDLYRRMRDRLVGARPDLRLYLFEGEPVHIWQSVPGAVLTNAVAAKDFLRACYAFDVDALKREPGIAVSFFYLSDGTRVAASHKRTDYQALPESDDWNRLFANDGKWGAYIWSGFTEYGYLIPKGKWIFAGSPAHCSYPWPTGDRMRETWLNVLLRSNPGFIVHTWIDCDMATGRQEELRAFARAYRSLPNGTYRRLTGKGRDANVWIEVCAKGNDCFGYAANPYPWPTAVTLVFQNRDRVRDGLLGREVKLRKGQWSFRLAPFDMQSFRVEGAGAGDAVQSASARPELADESAIDARIKGLESAAATYNGRPAEIRIPEQQAAYDVLAQTLERIAARRAMGDLGGAYELAGAWRARQARECVREVIHLIPWRVIGPFGNAGRSGFEKVLAPEQDYLAGKPFAERYATLEGDSAWLKCRGDREGRIDLNPLFKTNDYVVAYAAVNVYAPQKTNVVFRVYSDDGFKLWVNRALVGKLDAQRGTYLNLGNGGAMLVPGWNQVLLKVDDAVQGWEFLVTVTDTNRNSIADLRFKSPWE